MASGRIIVDVAEEKTDRRRGKMGETMIIVEWEEYSK